MIEIDTGHEPACVCGHCSQVRQECQWPESERYGHDWHIERANLLFCSHCDKKALWVMRRSKPVPPDVDGRMLVVELVGEAKGA